MGQVDNLPPIANRRSYNKDMANQGADRREVLEMLAKAAVASQFPGFSRWVFGQQHNHADAAPPARQPNYQPAYFSPSEFRTIDVLTGLIIPKDDSPGAQEAGVSEFIDFMAAHGEKEIRQPMRDGLQWLESAAQRDYGSTFVKLAPDQQTAILKTRSGTQRRWPRVLPPDPSLHSHGLLHQRHRNEGTGFSGIQNVQRIARLPAHQRSGTPPSARTQNIKCQRKSTT